MFDPWEEEARQVFGEIPKAELEAWLLSRDAMGGEAKCFADSVREFLNEGKGR